jgi:membrane protease YdiL (CAAX protease family)
LTDYRLPPNSEVRSASDQPPAAEQSTAAHQSPGTGGPPGGGTFSLEGRPVPSLYLLAWLLSAGGLGLLVAGWLGDAPPLLFIGLLLLTAGLAAAAGYQLVSRRRRPPQAYRGPSPLLLFGLWFALANLSSVVLLALGLGDRAAPAEAQVPPLSFLAALLVQTVAYLFVVWLFVVRGRALSWAEMGWPSRAGLNRVAGDLAFTVAVMVPVTFIALVGGSLVGTLLDARPPQVVPTPEDVEGLILVLVAAAVLAPVGEEVFFRGLALTAWLRDLGLRAALIRSSLFFALVHIANINVDPADGLFGVTRQALVILAVILPLALVLGWIFVKRGLHSAIVAHVTYNGILLVLLVVAARFNQLQPA